MPDDTPITELVDLDIERVDGVEAAANGLPFLLLKSLQDPAVAADVAAALDAPAEMPALDAAVAAEVAQVAKDIVQTVEGVDALAGAGPEDTEPGSPAWEAKDAATLRQVATMLAQIKNDLEEAGERERLEVMAGADDDDIYDAWDLDDACSALDCVLGIVARLAFTEQAQAESGGSVTKAGKVLSSKNEAAIRSARDALTALLGDGETNKPEEGDVTKSEVEQMLAAHTETIMKAIKGDTPAVAATDTATAADVAVEPAEVEKAADGTDGEPEPVAAVDPAAEVAKAADEATVAVEPVTVTTELVAVAVPDMAEVVKSAIIESQAATVDVLKAVLGPLAEVVKGLEERIETVEKQPMPGGPLLNGAAAPTAGGFMALRGQNMAEGDDVTRIEKKLNEGGLSPNDRALLQNELSQIRLRDAYASGRMDANI